MADGERFRVSTATTLRAVEWHNIYQGDYGEYDEEVGEFILNLQETGNRPIPYEIFEESGVLPLVNKVLKADGFEVVQLSSTRKDDPALFYLRRLEKGIKR